MTKDNYDNLLKENKKLGRRLICVGVYFTFLLCIGLPFNLLSNRFYGLIIIVSMACFITSCITWFFTSKDNISIQLRNGRASNALIIMGLDLLCEGMLEKFNVYQITKKVNERLAKIGFHTKIDYKTIKSKFKNNPTDIKPPIKGKRKQK